MTDDQLQSLTDYDLSIFIDKIHREPITVNDFEYKFIVSNANKARPHFSDKQRAVIIRMIQKYAVVIGWERPETFTEENLPF